MITKQRVRIYLTLISICWDDLYIRDICPYLLSANAGFDIVFVQGGAGISLMGRCFGGGASATRTPPFSIKIYVCLGMFRRCFGICLDDVVLGIC